MAARPGKSQSEKSFDFLSQMLERDWDQQSREMALEAGQSLGKTVAETDNPAFHRGVVEAMRKNELVPKSADLETLRQTINSLRLPSPAPLPSAPSPQSERKPRKRAKRIPLDEQIARRVLKRQRSSVVILLKKAGLAAEFKELLEVEKRIGEGTHQAAKHAAFSARNLMQGAADGLHPPSSKKWRDREGRQHSLGSKDHKNRLIAFVDKRLKGRLEGHDFRAFVGTMDIVMRWTGSGPHGVYKLQEAERLYTRMLDALAVIALAYEAEPA